jgi:serine kinase of HPr protein (carbohydrate metabolism regulator)
MFSLLCCCEVGGSVDIFGQIDWSYLRKTNNQNQKKRAKKQHKHKTPPLIERRYKYITHIKQASKQERFRLQKATREEEQ